VTTRLFIRTDLEVFTNPDELPNILESLAQQLRDTGDLPLNINDSHGNTVGNVISFYASNDEVI
jgi:hypothetical protein